MSTKTHVSGQKKKEAESPEGRKEPANDRYRKRLHITLDPAIYEWLKKSTDNASRFIENLVNAVSQGIQPLAFVISKTDTGRRGFEPPTAGLRVPRSTWLSYRPPFSFCSQILSLSIHLSSLIPLSEWLSSFELKNFMLPP